ncbi:type VI secretion system membrane subunit TssM [Pseudomonas sp. SCB32]|uniref:type VI secretion system membrane subunit TssM n=1 Tax=Pseudomonas sp. SCB32 TaxID=2653853 RepID=UPI0012640638|nr:type VI secretion system membrane subunit TssM [Pseudomonas sp. SCB32]
MSQWLRWLRSPALWVLLGLLALAALIWLVGPEIAIGRHRPLYNESARIVLIALLLGLFFLRVGWRRLRMAYTNSQLLEHLRSRSQGNDLADAQQQALAERFDVAIATLKQARFDKDERRWSLRRLSRQYLYQLPWYIVVGAPGSGKTTALLNSGLKFPLAGSIGKAAVEGVGGTRQCDWWFTNDAVLIDTAGRYSTQDSDQPVDSAEWNSFLGLLKKYRPRQPVNGVMLTISVADLLGSSAQEQARLAHELRKRLQELNRQLGITFPVYVLVTKLDLLAGFNQYFAALDRPEREQVWGFTLPLKEEQRGSPELAGEFAAEYGLLYQRLRQYLPDRLGESRPLEESAQAYLLPQEFAALEEPLRQFLLEVFSTSKFEFPVLLRGLYFTSATQEGTVFDRVMGAIKRNLGLPESSQPSLNQNGAQGFFLKRLMQEVVFREVALAGRNLLWERRRRVLRGAGHVALALLLVAGGWILWRAYGLNRAYLDEVSEKVPALGLHGQTIQSHAGDILQVLPWLDRLRELPDSSHFEVTSPPWRLRLGLYQGWTVEQSSDLLYRHGLRDMLLPQVASYIQQRLRQETPNDHYTYEALKAYLMLYDEQHYDGAYLRDWLYINLRHELPDGFTEAEGEQLEQHLKQLLEPGPVRSPYPMDTSLVEQTRLQLGRLPLVQRAYQRIRYQLLLDEPANAFSVISAAGPDASQSLRRQSGLPLTEGIPTLFTYTGYHDLFMPNAIRLQGQLQNDDTWVLNLALRPEELLPDYQANLLRQLQALYLNEYVQVWDNYLNDLTLVPITSLAQAAQVSRTLSALDSPLERLIRAAARETTLLRPMNKAVQDFADRAGNKLNSTREHLQRLVGRLDESNRPKPSVKPEAPERIVDDHFASLRRMTDEAASGQGGPLDNLRQLLNELYVYLTATESALRSGNPPPPSDILAKVDASAGRAPLGVREMLGALTEITRTQTRTVERNKLQQDISGSIGSFCRRAVLGRYPFSAKAQQEVAVGDFARLFAPNGLFDTFFQQNLADKVNQATNPWSFNPGFSGPTGDLRSFERASLLRSVFFAKGNAPSMDLRVRVVSMDPEIARLSLNAGGQSLEYMHGPQVPLAVSWPAPQGTDQVRLSIDTRDGRSASLAGQGLWAWHRLFDKARMEAGSSPDLFTLHYNLEGHAVALEVRTDSLYSPFRLSALRNFNCPGGGIKP